MVFLFIVTARLVSDSAFDLIEGGRQSSVIHSVHILLGDHYDIFIHLLEWFPGTLGLVVPLSSYVNVIIVPRTCCGSSILHRASLSEVDCFASDWGYPQVVAHRHSFLSATAPLFT